MKYSILILTLLTASALLPAAADSTTDNTSSAAFSRLKTLAGEWEAPMKEGAAHLSYELISGGTALMERESAPNMPVMMTVYHVDGSRLLLTHYCMTGNQPRMQESSFDPAKGEIVFQFLDATNMKSPNDGHMHNATLRLVDADHLVSTWQFYENGQAKSTESLSYTRVK